MMDANYIKRKGEKSEKELKTFLKELAHLQELADSEEVKKLVESKPSLVWLEPNPREVDLKTPNGRRIDSPSLTEGFPAWLNGENEPSMVEARLFWDRAALHVIADPGGESCRWDLLWETQTPSEDGIRVRRDEYPVHTLKDRARFGFEIESADLKLKMVEYREGGRLVAWRLVREVT